MEPKVALHDNIRINNTQGGESSLTAGCHSKKCKQVIFNLSVQALSLLSLK